MMNLISTSLPADVLSDSRRRACLRRSEARLGHACTPSSSRGRCADAGLDILREKKSGDPQTTVKDVWQKLVAIFFRYRCCMRGVSSASADALVDRGASLAERGDFAAAELYFRAAASDKGAGPRTVLAAKRNLGHVLLQGDRPTEAAVSYRSALAVAEEAPAGGDWLEKEEYDQLRAECAAAHFEGARHAQSSDDIEQVVSELLAAVDLQPKEVELGVALAEAQHAMGVGYHAAGRSQEALTSFAAAEATGLQQHAPLLINRGVALRAVSRLAEAASVTRAALSLAPHSVDAHINLGHMLTQLARRGRAAPFDKSGPSSERSIGRSSERSIGPSSERSTGAATLVATSVDAHDATASLVAAPMAALRDRGAAETAGDGSSNGDGGAGAGARGSSALLAEASALFVAAMHLGPSSGDAYYYAANALRAQRRTEEALAVYERGITAAPAHAGLRSSLAYALMSRGAAQAQRGAALLREGESWGLWKRAWQHPPELLQTTVAVGGGIEARGSTGGNGAGDGDGALGFGDAHGGERTPPRPVHAPGGGARGSGWECVLQPLEHASAHIAAEALAVLPDFLVQHEAIASPHGGWREYEVRSRCAARPPGLRHTCAALDAVAASLSRRSHATSAGARGRSHAPLAAGGVQISGAAFSALVPGTRLHPHCGTTNSRLTLHLGLHIPPPQRGVAYLRIGRPRVIDAPVSTATSRAGSDRAPGTCRSADGAGRTDEQSDSSFDYMELTWRNGTAFVWDDSFAHEIYWTNTSTPPPALGPTWAIDPDGQFLSGGPRVILLLSLRNAGLQPAPCL